jgi:hypothetical protein
MMFRAAYRLFALGLILQTAVSTAIAQGTDIRGIVADSVTAQRIPFANVVILGTTKGAATNNSGFYLIPSVPPGKYEIAVSIIGYRRKVQRITVRPGNPIELNFRLSPTPVEGEEVLVTAPKRQELSEITPSMHLLEQKDLKMAPSLVQEDVLKSLEVLPGIVSTSDVSSRFYVRGGAGDQNLVLLDGMKIYNPFHALGIFSVFDPDIVQNVEMYTGAFPAGYGGRLSSVVNITARDGREDRLAGRASVNFLSSKLQLEGPSLTGTSWMVNARKSLFNQTFKRLTNQNVPVSFYDFFLKIKTQFLGIEKVNLSVLSSSDQLLFSAPDEPNYNWRTTAFCISSSGLLGDRVFIETFLYNSVYRAERDAKASTSTTPASNLVEEPGLRTTMTYYTDAQDRFIFGADFSFPTIEYKVVNLAGSTVDVYDSFVEAAAWIRYQARYMRWLLDVGVHADFGSMIVGEQGIEGFQPRLNVSYELFGNWKAKASAGLFSQHSITVNNEDDVMSILDAWIKVPQDIPPEKAVHFVLGADGNINEATSLSVQSYYKLYTSLVVYNRDKVFITDPDYIRGRGRSYGAELLLRTKVSMVDLYAAYSLSWAILDNQGLTYYPRYDRRHHLNLLASLQPIEHFDLSLRWEYGSGFPYSQSMGYYDRLLLGNPLRTSFELETGEPYLVLGEKNAARLPAYHRLDLSLTYRFDLFGAKWALGGQIINVYDHKNIFYFDRKTGQHTEMLRFFPSANLTLEY